MKRIATDMFETIFRKLRLRRWAVPAAGLALLAALLPAQVLPAAWQDESLRLEGAITTDSFERLKADWDAAPGRYRRVILDSEGGELFPAAAIAAFIRQRGLDTHVGAGDRCRSACTLVFQAGVRRTAHPTATFAYHCVIVQVPDSDRCYVSTPFTRYYKDAMKYYGAPAALLDRIVPDETVRLTAREALDYGIATELDEGH